MNILHVLADWKWTGPVPPTMDLCRALARRGHAVAVACMATPPGHGEGLVERLRAEAPVPVEPVLTERRRIALWKYRHDVRALAELIRGRAVKVVHAHTTHDHILAGLAARRVGGVRVVRTNHTGLPIRGRVGEHLLFQSWTDLYLTYSTRGLQADLKRLPPLRGMALLPGMDLKRYESVDGAAEARARLGVPPDAFLVGTVMRVQRHRRVDILLEAVRSLPKVRLAVIGRGTRIQELAVDPARRMGIADRVIFTGFLEADYLSTLSALDAFVMLRPGSDGTARALREAMALGRPVIGGTYGLIPELLDGGRAGSIVGDSPRSVAQAIAELVRDRELRETLAQAARRKAMRDFGIEPMAAAVERAYTAATSGSTS
jgi:glycosyltransferase involved in cell wall biosynthesis